MDSEKEDRRKIYRKIEETYLKVMAMANEKIKLTKELSGINGTCHFFSEKYPSEKEINEIVGELIQFAVKSIREDKSNHICVKPDKSYPLLHKYLNGLTIQRNTLNTDWGCDFFIVT